MVAWIYLVIAICLEVTATTSLKLSHGLTKLVPTIIVAVGYVGSFALLALVLQTIDVSVAYAIWAGSGTALVAVVSWLFLDERISPLSWVGIALIVAGVVMVEAFSEQAA